MSRADSTVETWAASAPDSRLQPVAIACCWARKPTSSRAELGSGSFELILCDVNLPGESGLELVQEVVAGRTDVAVLMVSGADDPQLAEAALALGAYGYIVKPFRDSEVNIGIANALNVFDPEVVAVGGGVSIAGDLLLAPAEEVARRFALPGCGEHTVIRLSRWGPQAGVRGAALMAAMALREEEQVPV